MKPRCTVRGCGAALVLGRGDLRDRVEALRAAFAPFFRETDRARVRERRRCGPEAARDPLAATYRGLRRHEAERAAALGATDVTLAADPLVLEARGGDDPVNGPDRRIE